MGGRGRWGVRSGNNCKPHSNLCASGHGMVEMQPQAQRPPVFIYFYQNQKCSLKFRIVTEVIISR